MAMETAMGLTNRLLAQAQALGAVTAYLQLSAKGAEANPELRKRLDHVVDVLDVRDALDALSEQERDIVVAFSRSYFHQTLELMDDPQRDNAWSHTDPTILQAQGTASAVVATLIAQAGLGGQGIRILDIGTGVARLAIAFVHTFQDATVVGLDPWPPAFKLARENVASAGLESRIALHQMTIEAFEDSSGFDLIWLPSFFIPEPVLNDAFRRASRLLRKDGALVVGMYDASDDPLAGAVDAMITVRSGGAVLEPAVAIERLRNAGFDDAREAERVWKAPLRLVVARLA